MQMIIRFLVCLGLALIPVSFYMFVLGVFLNKESAVIAGMNVVIGIMSIALIPMYKAEAKNIWRNIKRNFWKGR